MDGRDGELRLTRFGPEHLDQALGLSQALNWPYRREDWAFAADLGSGFAAERDGHLLGTALWWPYGTNFASAGMIIVSGNAQRQGIGARLTDALLADASGRPIILNSTREGAALYARLGFRPYGRIIQHQAKLDRRPQPVANVALRRNRDDERAAILALDRAGSGMERARMVGAVLDMADTVVVERDGRIAGYGCVRRWGRGVVIGPIIAGGQTDARAIIAALAAGCVGEFVRIDVTDHSGLAAWLEELGLPAVDDAESMVLGTPPEASAQATLFALANQSLG